MWNVGEPVDCVDLVNHPLIRNARREGPEETEFEMMARIERQLGIAVDEEAFPIRILLLHHLDFLDAPPAARLVDVPGHLGHHYVAELAGIEIFLGANIFRRRAALRADLD